MGDDHCEEALDAGEFAPWLAGMEAARGLQHAIRRLAASRPLPDDEDLIATTYTSADFREGVQAFLEKRKARWTGR